MNKQRYLAELHQLLIFMTAADREETLSRFGALFDDAGPDGADALVRRLGSPTKNAIRLSRTYAPGHLTDEYLFAGIPMKAPAQEETASAHDHLPLADDMPDFELPSLDIPDVPDMPLPPGHIVTKNTPQPEPEPAPAPEAEPQPETAPPAPETPAPSDNKEPTPPRFVSMPLDAPHEPRPRPQPRTVVKRSMPLWAGIPLFVILLLVLAVPVGLVCLVLLPVLLAPGLAILVAAWLAAVGGLWCISYIADAVMLFGLAFVVLGVALLVLWCGVWLDVGLVTLYIRALRGMKHLFLGRTVTEYA